MVKHKLLYAKDLLETLKNANDNLLVDNWFWIIQNMRFAKSINNHNNNNLQQLLLKDAMYYMKFDIHSFGASF
jgi:hypothetical protein